MRTTFVSLVLLVLLGLPSVALAGGCPTCTSDADCTVPGGGPAFCVEWSRDFGCGTQRIACCPGQACDTFSGRPSCEGADGDGDGVDDCHVLGADVDAGPSDTDAGSSDTDAGSSGTDGGSSGTDAGGGPMDGGGTAGVDAGTGGTDGGCSCRAGTTRADGWSLAALSALMFVWRRNRRR
ncbi:MAG: hypothetical protein KC619_05425 [Myxococcales bacterium]|nr:hypothetical protein [Myxococcales bacterium]